MIATGGVGIAIDNASCPGVVDSKTAVEPVVERERRTIQERGRPLYSIGRLMWLRARACSAKVKEQRNGRIHRSEMFGVAG